MIKKKALSFAGDVPDGVPAQNAGTAPAERC
jgi:hypothetical protein